MIHLLLCKHCKGIASALLSVFFSQLSLSSYSLQKHEHVVAPFDDRQQAISFSSFYNTAHLAKGHRVSTKNPHSQSPVTGRNASVEIYKKTQPQFTGPGPGQPEMQAFQSVNSSNLVDMFTGDFSYSIPLMDVGGYPVNIHYRSGITMDQEASWVGLGWNINPGTISRNMRGLPDDFNGEDVVTKTHSIRPNWTAGGNVALGMEIFGYELNPLNAGLNGSLFYNNYKGIGISAGTSIGYQSSLGSKGSFTARMGLQSNSQSGISIAPSFEVNFKNKNGEASGVMSGGYSVSSSFSTRSGLQSLSIASVGRMKYRNDTKNNSSSSYATVSRDLAQISFAHQAYTPAANIPFTSYQFSFNLKPGGEAFGLHPNVSFGGFYSRQYIADDDKKQSLPAFGYMYYQKARNIANALLDYNREKELTYRVSPPTPHIAIPNYTYDVYNITAEGTGGMFRPYRGDIGYMRDADVRSKSLDGSISLDLGAGNLVHAGYDVRVNSAVTNNTAWTEGNLLALQLPFKESDSSFEAVYFKNPAEKTINQQSYYDKLGDTDPVLPLMSKNDDPTLSPFIQRYKNMLPRGDKIKVDSSQTIKRYRDKRTQVISYLTAADADLFALDKKILLYPVNTFYAGKCDIETCNDPDPLNCKKIMAESRISSFRKKHHLSEITVLNADGRRYVYGLPVYNTIQQEVSFSVDKSYSDTQTGLVEYAPGLDNTINNKKGKDNFYAVEELPAYAHSFLLTGIVSADYVDKTGDGISDDDMGDAVKFNYSRLYGSNGMFRWRTPFAQNKATYNEGLKTDNSDDKGSYIYGEKEIWYLHSLESKSMIATFTLSDPQKGEIREDAYGVKGENGGSDMQQPLRYLKQIDLFSKSDYLLNKETAKPIKTVHFEYSYELCQGNPSSSAGKGKLTLKKIWFTYNKNNKGQKNPYIFLYHSMDARDANSLPKPEYNPAYDPKGFDRWGNYKDAANNPANMTNAEYPYTLQDGNKTGNGVWDSAHAATAVAAWTLSDIILPSTGRLNVQYESDDYAYVQNKRAMQMCSIAGFGTSDNLNNKTNNLYGGATEAYRDYRYVFIHVPSAITATSSVEIKKEILQKYLAGASKLYFRLSVKMPADVYGSGYERVATYAQYEDYGLTTDKNIIWIKIKGTDILTPGDGDASPLAKTTLQVLRLNLPSKAYPGSDLDGDFDALAVVKATFAAMSNISELFLKFPVQARVRGWAKTVDTEQSFVRLTSPGYKKYGDGLRVKRITVYDNWAAMTDGAAQEATYGQEYDYTAIKDINGVKTTISSGVASYEPGIGNEENPFREPIEYDEQIAPLAPVSNMYSEHPLGEAFFPSASVGYSKVRVHSIHHKDVKSANGFQESEFYTTYDFPTIVEQTPLEKRKYNSESLLNILNLYSKKALAFSQGFKIETNDMNGKLKGSASYPENDPYNALAYTKYYYKVEDENAEHKRLTNTVSVVDSANGHINPQAQVGKDIELMADMREQEFKSQGASVEFNIDGFMIGPIPVTIPFPWLLPHFELNRFRSAAITKVVQRYGILDKVLTYEKGSLATTENLLYDGETGDVLLTRTLNEFNDPVYQFSYPAHWAYTGMGPAYTNIGAVFKNISFTNGKITSASAYPGIERYFESGDEIKVADGLEKQAENNGVNPCTGFGICNQPVMGATSTKKIWAVHASKIQRNHGLSGMYFIDENGRFFTATATNLQILRSGKRNMPATSIGTVVSLQNPMRQVTGKWKLILDSTTKVVNTSAASYSDLWKVEDAKYQPLTVTTRTNARKKIVLNPVPEQTFAISRDFRRRASGQTYDETWRPFVKAPYFEASEDLKNKNTRHELQSWMNFDFTEIPLHATIVSATLSLFPHLGDHTEVRSVNHDIQRNHTPTQPHRQDGGSKMNESYLKIDFNPVLNSIDLTTLTDNPKGDNSHTQTKDLFNNLDNLSVAAATIFATDKQNSVQLNVKNLILESLGKGRLNTWFKLYGGGGGSNNRNKLCFWSVNSYTQDDVNGCNKYGPVGSNNNPNALQIQATPQQTDAGITPLVFLPECNSCSVVTDGYDPGSKLNFTCSTAPQLVIEYISCTDGDRLVQECDSFYCEKTVAPDTCISQVTDTATNPYRWGVLGNWRMDRAYSYYENRTGSEMPDNDSKTNIRAYGTVNEFVPYWAFNANSIAPSSDTVRWVWNTQTTQFNRKGFETENKDPLGRHNAVQYGYNESLPVAVTQNSKYAEHAFDGFEDYSYDNSKCDTRCSIQKHISSAALIPFVTDEEAHSGKYSLGLPVGTDARISAVLEDTQRTQVSPSLQFKLDTAYRGTIDRV
ncbi:MAG TPA: hypothetical protein VFV68_01770, partial [Agriterribacter sp.]|nr:hypothetical protein [Agriterribacter sp.]